MSGAAQTLDVSATCLRLGRGPILLLLAHAFVDFCPEAEIERVEVRAAVWKIKCPNATRRFGLHALVGLIARWIVVLKGCETWFACTWPVAALAQAQAGAGSNQDCELGLALGAG